MSNAVSAMPGTILTASVHLKLNLAPAQKVLSTISLLENVHFNECEAPAFFSVLFLQVERKEDLRIELTSMGDAIEDAPRYTEFREFTVEITNLSGSIALADYEIQLLLKGFPPAPTRKLSEFQRKPALAVVNTVGPVSAFNRNGTPLAVQTRAA